MDPIIGEIVKTGAGAGPVGTLSDAWQAIIGDRVAAWRLRRAMELQLKANEEARRLGLSLNTARIPERYAFAWFEEATKQDEPEIQTLFARLLARAAAGDEDAQDRRLIQVLSQLTPIDAAIFQRIYSPQPFPGTGIYSETKAITEPMTLDKSLRGWPRDWAVALVANFHGEAAEKSLEQLIIAGVLAAGFQAEGSPNAGSLRSPTAPRDAFARASNWRTFIRAHAALRPYVLPTAFGASLYRAVHEDEEVAGDQAGGA